MINDTNNCFFGCQGKRDASSYPAGAAGNDYYFFLEM